MAWTANEFARLVTALSVDDPKSAALTILDLIDARTQHHRDDVNAQLDTLAASTTTALAGKLSAGFSVTNPGWVLDATYQPSPLYVCRVSATFQLDITLALLNPDSIGVSILSDESDPPVGVVGRAFKYGNQTIGLSVTANHVIREQVVAWVKPGHFIRFATAGTGAAVLNNLRVETHDG